MEVTTGGAALNALRITEIPLHDKLLLLGPPGIGKTEVVRQLAEREARLMGRIFIDVDEYLEKGGDLLALYEEVKRNPTKYYIYYRIVATHVTPESLDVPVPLAEAGYKSFVYATPLVFSILSVPGVAGTLFIDEITNVQRDDTKSVMYALIQEKRLGANLKLSPLVKIVAAGNPPEVSSLAGELPAPLLNRLTRIDTAPATLNEWQEYMMSVNLVKLWNIVRDVYRYALERIYERVPAEAKKKLCANVSSEEECKERVFHEIFRETYLKVLTKALNYLYGKNAGENEYGVPVHFMAREIPESTLENFPTPRSWTRVVNQLAIEELLRRAGLISDLLYEKRVQAIAIGSLGPDVGNEFQNAYLHAYISPVEITEAVERGELDKLVNSILEGVKRGDENAKTKWLSFTFSVARLPLVLLGSTILTAERILEDMLARGLASRENLAKLTTATAARLLLNTSKLEKTIQALESIAERVEPRYGNMIKQAIAEAVSTLKEISARIDKLYSELNKALKEHGVNCESGEREHEMVCTALRFIIRVKSRLATLNEVARSVVEGESYKHAVDRLLGGVERGQREGA